MDLILQFDGVMIMRVACVSQPGPAANLKVAEIPQPVPGPGQALVRITAASVNPIDTYLRSGAIPWPGPWPFVPGCDLAGIVEEVGADATRFTPGQRVWASNQGLIGRQGSLAEWIAVDEHWLAPTPATMSDEQAAAGALTGITAHLGLFLHGGLQPGQTVFVNGGTGGVGSLVLQFAVRAGARVIATAGTEEKRQQCLTWGAARALDYNAPALDQELRDAVQPHGGVDLWWETQREPNLPRAIEFMKKRGRIILMAGRQAEPSFPLGQFYTNDLKLVGFAMFNASPAEQQICMDDMNRWFEQGVWRPTIGARFSLDEAAAAHQLQEDSTLHKKGRLTGKIVVLP